MGDADYQPIDLAPWCNARGEALGGAPPIAGGDRVFHGLPFHVAPAEPEGPGFILLEPAGDAIVIPVGRPARSVLFAHRRRPEPVTAGEVVAEYAFDVEGRSPEVVPIRDRFEIGVVSDDWAWDTPFLAVGVGTSEGFDRRRGPWGDAGLRQTEMGWEESVELFLWAWESPEPELTLRSLTLRPGRTAVLVAAITTGHVAEHPLLRDASVPVRISMSGPVLPSPAADLEVGVDRGVVSFPYPLPGQETETFLADDLRGWGEPHDPATPHAYTRIAALPSATVTVNGNEGEIARFSWGDLIATGGGEDRGTRLEIVESGKNWVHVTVLDDETDEPVPCRVHFRTPEGVPYQPYGHHSHVNSDLSTWHIDVGGDVRLGRLSYAYIDGTCQGWLPTGEIIADVARGFEYEPLRQRIVIGAGQRRLVLRLKRWTSMEGWYSGDSHVHFLSAQGALTEQQGEDLNVVNLLQSQWGSLFTNTEDFTGEPHIASDDRYVTHVSQENRQHFLGHLILWGLRQPVMPWCTDGPVEAEEGGSLEVTESDWADRCHEQGGTVVIPHFPAPNGEPATLIATGRADAIEMIVQTQRSHEEYYRYLNCGYRLPLVGGTDKMSSEVPVGLYRTYARLGDIPFGYRAWTDAVRAGRTFMSGGPLLTLDVDGNGIGETVRIVGGGTVTVSAEAASVFPVSKLEIVHNGRVVAATSENGGTRRLALTAEIRIESDSWLAARCGGPNYFDGPQHRDEWGRRIFAHTSPIYLTTKDEWGLFDSGQAHYMLTMIEGGLAYVRNRAARYARGHITHHHGEGDHLGYLERPFLEAQQAVRRRLDRDR